jgi:Pentapeptide repeats (8 copies)
MAGKGSSVRRTPSRQVRRKREREFSTHPQPVGRLEIVVAVGTFLLVSALNLLAAVADLQAFDAVATPLLACWFVLCLLCSVGLLLMVGARRRGVDVPLSFRVLLMLGMLAGALTISPAVRVLTKDDAEAQEPVPKTNLDLRNQQVEDVSFAGRALRHADFSGATLTHVDLSGVNLNESDLRNVTLHDVDLSGAKLCGADLRGADLRGARGLEAVADWSYTFYDGKTRLPKGLGYLLLALPGPIEDMGRDLLYMCSTGQVRRIEA